MLFESLPDSSRLWLLALDSPLDEATEARLWQGVREILGQWRHKGQAYEGAVQVLHHQILAVAEPKLAEHPSGCAISAMLNKVQRLLDQLELRLVEPSDTVLVRLGGDLRVVPKSELESRLADGTLAAGTPVFDLSLFTLGDLRAGLLEKPLQATWIGRKFRLSA